MRVYAISDLHVDYPENLQWVESLAARQYQQDILILAGDVTDDTDLLLQVLRHLVGAFRKVLFVPGNHELWISNGRHQCSLQKFHEIRQRCRDAGVICEPYTLGRITFVPLFSWYDYSFARPDRHLLRAWRDYRACRWPAELADSDAISRHFLSMNHAALASSNQLVISYSHFLPRIDLMPDRIPANKRKVYPVLGSAGLGQQLAQLQPDIHVYGHSHVNRAIELDGIRFVNNAFGYPGEERISRKQLYCIHTEPGHAG